MRPYEIVYVLDASLDRDAAAEKIDGFHEVLGGEVEAVDHWGVRRLAYPIAKARLAYYAVAHVKAEPSALPEFERRLRLDEQVVRYLLVLNEGQPTSGDSIFAQAAKAAEEDAGGDEGTPGKNGGDPSAAPAETDENGGGESPSTAEGGADSGDETPAPAEAPGEPDAGAAESGEGSSGSGGGTGPAAETGETASGPGDGAEAARGEEGESERTAPVHGPPEFSGARGRGRRHDAPRILLLDYKDVATLSHFVSEQGKILPKRTTKVTARFQRRLGTAVKRARYLALLPYVRDHGS